MAQFNSDSHEGLSNLPTNSHGGMVMSHRCAVTFAVAATIAIGDKFVLGVLPAGYTVQGITADSDGIAGLSVNLVQAEGLGAGDAKLALSSGVSLVTAGGAIAAPLTKDAARFKGSNNNLYLVAEVTAGGSVIAGKEVGVTVSYRYRQVAY